MLFFENTSLDPWFNLATEEYLFKHIDSEVVMLWRSLPSIIVGKHQNTLAEINLEYVRKNNIPVVRRLSGGGTVFHDPGNINFTFIKKADKDNLVNFQSHTRPVIEFLQSLGVDAKFEGKNDLRVNGLKISGNAEHIHKNKVLHHGTLLYDANLDHLNEAIKAKEENFESKAVKSIRSEVANISRFLQFPLSRDEFMMKLKVWFFQHWPDIEFYSPDQADIRYINRIKEEKYKKWEWNFGWSPVYVFKNQIYWDNKVISVELKVRKGMVETAMVLVDGKKLDEKHLLIKGLENKPHNPDNIEELLAEINFFEFNSFSDPWALLKLFF